MLPDEGDVLDGGPSRHRILRGVSLALFVLIIVVLVWNGFPRQHNQAGIALSKVHARWNIISVGGSELLLTETLKNDGDNAIQVLALGGDLPGLRLLHVYASGQDLPDGPRPDAFSAPITIDAHGSQDFGFDYRVNDCDAARSGPAAIPMHVKLNAEDARRVLLDESGVTMTILMDQAFREDPCSPAK